MKAKVLLFIALIAVIAFWFIKNPHLISAKGVISGTININGPIPNGSTISIAAKKAGMDQFTVVITGIVATDGVTWDWNGAEEGASYELQGSLIDGGTTLSQSAVLAVAAPATEETLVFNISVPNNNNETGGISGIVDVNGPVPQGATINIGQRKQGESIYAVAISGLSATDGVSWNWTGAQKGIVYEMKAFLKLNNTNYAESKNTLTVASPAGNEVLVLNVPVPTQTVTTVVPAQISGKINLNGSNPSGTSISIAQRVTGSNGQFNTVVNSLSATNNVAWTWSGATSGVPYDLVANLISNGKTIATSAVLSVTAPASNEVLTINSYANLPVPQYSPGISCVGANGNNNWQVNVSYHSVTGANLYWIQIVDTNNNLVVNSQIPPNNQQLPTTYNFNTDYLFSQGATYYAKYAYSPCSSCTGVSSYSPFTPTNQFNCTQPTAAPNPTYTPYPTNTVYPTNPPVPTNAPVAPTNTPKPPTATLPPRTSKCNESCGGNGYSCVVGLQCVSGQALGSSVCRNPNCTDQTDCTCN